MTNVAEVASPSRAHWRSRIGFMMATAGSAVGLGNIWKFPYITGVNGGGAFVLTFLIAIVFVGLPLIIAEFYIGFRAQSNLVKAFDVSTPLKSVWRIPGWLALISAFIILSYYSVVGGWVLDFLYLSTTNQFAGHSDQEISAFLDMLFSNPSRQVFCHFIFMSITIGVIVGGVQKGIERWNLILMPTLFLILIGLFFYVCFLPGFDQSLNFMFSADTSKLKPAGVLEAVGHAFFSLSLGVGCMITYGSYLSSKDALLKTAVAIALVDTLIALFMGVIIFSVIFSFGLSVDSGPTLLFQTLPRLFMKMSGGYAISVAFFLLVTFAALTSAMSLLEVIVAYWCETFGGSRKSVSIAAGASMFLLGILSAFSTNILKDFKIIGMTVFGLFDKITSSLTMPLSGLFIGLFFGWVLGESAIKSLSETGIFPKWAQTMLLWLTRVVAPLAIFIILMKGIMDW